MADKINILKKENESEKANRNSLIDLFRNAPIPDQELIQNLGVFVSRQSMTRYLFLYELYKQILETHGVIMEFGVRWGQDLAMFESFRGMFEPYNYNRKIIGFDTFEGFPEVHEKDGEHPVIEVGAYSVTQNYEQFLGKVLECHESKNPISHIKKSELRKGNATHTLAKYLEEHPETIIALAYFDFDIYEPTKVCLELIKPHLTKGSIIVFDELNHPEFPGETVAVKEVLGLQNIRLKRFPFMSYPSYCVVE